MPFQVVYNVFQVPPGEITYYSAGADQQVICGFAVTLQAIIIGDVTGHTFEWEGPISGTPLGIEVTQSDFSTTRLPDTGFGGWQGTTLYYVNHAEVGDPEYVPGADFDDKVWRFWIDRGTSVEKYDDIKIYGTPTSLCFTGIPESMFRTPRCAYNHPILEGDVFNRIPTLRLLRGFSDSPYQDGVDGNGTNNHITLQWSAPVLTSPVVQYHLQARTTTGGAWNTVAVVLPTSPLTYLNPVVGTVYRVVAITEETNSRPYAIASNTVYVDPAPYSQVTEDVYHISSPTSLGVGLATESVMTYEVSMVTLRTFISPDDFGPDILYTDGETNSIERSRITSYSAVLLTLKTFYAPGDFDADSMFTDAEPNSPTRSRITAYTVQNLTGGGIGGQ